MLNYQVLMIVGIGAIFLAAAMFYIADEHLRDRWQAITAVFSLLLAFVSLALLAMAALQREQVFLEALGGLP